jgi:hypothetical protein
MPLRLLALLPKRQRVVCLRCGSALGPPSSSALAETEGTLLGGTTSEAALAGKETNNPREHSPMIPAKKRTRP